MAPRQRQLSPSVSLSSDDGRREAEPLVPSTKGPTTTTMAPLMLETREDAAREKHDLFNILALVRLRLRLSCYTTTVVVAILL